MIQKEQKHHFKQNLINLEKRNDEIASVCKVLSESVDENLQDDNVTEVAE